MTFLEFADKHHDGVFIAFVILCITIAWIVGDLSKALAARKL